MTPTIASLLVFVPLVSAVLAYLLRGMRRRTVLLVAIAVAHTVGVAVLWLRPAESRPGSWLNVDDLGLVVLSVVSLLFLAVSFYAAASARAETPRGDRAFVSCLLSFLAATSLVAVSQHMALLWVGMEATTLAIAPLIYSRHDRRSLEAVWKYLVLSSVGIALALLAVFFLAASQLNDPGSRALLMPDLVGRAAHLDGRWLRGGYVFALAGFGTKMGLAPFHTWKPDTYGEAPSLVGGLMAGALTTCAFLALARFTQVITAAGLQSFARPLLITAGLFSLLVATAFIIGQADIKRLLAYSSVEHMGLLVLGLGLGGVGPYGSVLHLINNGLVKGMLFLVVGNLVLAAGTSVVADMRGMQRMRPFSGWLLLIGLFAVTGSPPFGLFISEFVIVSAAVQQHHPWVATATVMMLATIFAGIAAMIVEILYGAAPEGERETSATERAPYLFGPVVLGSLVLLLGLYIPAPLQGLVGRAAASLGGTTP
jgi:hydrogenase-4 component F